MTPDPCKSCAHRLNDVSEGQLCRKVPRKIVLSDGETLAWPGCPLNVAMETCGGRLAEKSVFAWLSYLFGI